MTVIIVLCIFLREIRKYKTNENCSLIYKNKKILAYYQTCN